MARFAIRLNTLIDTSDPVTPTRSRTNTFAERLYWQPWKRDIGRNRGAVRPVPDEIREVWWCKMNARKLAPAKQKQHSQNTAFIDCLLNSQVTQRATSSHGRAQKKCWCLSIAISNLEIINNVPGRVKPGYSKTHLVWLDQTKKKTCHVLDIVTVSKGCNRA